MDWTCLKNDILTAYPFLTKARFGLPDTASFPMPPLLTVGSFAAINVINDELGAKNLLAMIFPQAESVACYIAAAASLASIKKQVDQGLGTLPALTPGEKVLLDGVDFTFLGEVVDKGQAYYKFSYADEGTTKSIPVTSSNRMRIQHSVSTRNLAKRDKKAIKNVTDPILGLKLQGNTSLFQTKVVLVSGINAVREQVSDLRLSSSADECSKLAHVFGWGSLSEENEVRIWGSSGKKEEPLVLVASNFADVYEYVEYSSLPPDVIIVDGTSCLRDLSTFELLLNTNIPFLFVLSGKDHDGIQYLKKKNFAFWAWNSGDLALLHGEHSETEESPFFHLQKQIASFATFDVEVIDCSNPALEKSFGLLKQAERELTDDDFQASEILSRTFGLFIGISRSVSDLPLTSDRYETALCLIESDLATHRHFLSPEFLSRLTETVGLLRDAISLLAEENAKPSRLRAAISQALSDGYEKICVVLNKTDFEAEKEALARAFPGDKVVFERSSGFRMSDDFEWVILCGYLNRKYMLRVFNDALSTNLTVLNYAFEKQWITSVKNQFFGAFDNHAFRNHSVFGKRASEPPASPPEHPTTTATLEQFELKLHEFKRQRILKGLTEDAGGQKVRARCVTFTQGSFAFLTESHSVPVINELLGGKSKVDKLPQKKLKDIAAEDLLLFRESSARNLVRDVADILLEKGGKGELRKEASRWRGALEKVYEVSAASLSKVKAELKAHGCDRNELTIKNWLFDKDQIAPGEDTDILVIAEAANDHDLLRDIDAVADAIHQVRGAHIQASHQIAKLLEKRIKGELRDLSDMDVEVKVPGLGKVFVVCVESIDSAQVDVPSHKVNRLLLEGQF